MRTLSLLVALLAPLFVEAEIDESSCANRDRSLVLEVAYDYTGSATEMAADVAAVALVKIVRQKGRTGVEEIRMSGTGNSTTKGPGFEFKGQDGSEFVLSPPASSFPSELKRNGQTISLKCD